VATFEVLWDKYWCNRFIQSHLESRFYCQRRKPFKWLPLNTCSKEFYRLISIFSALKNTTHLFEGSIGSNFPHTSSTTRGPTLIWHQPFAECESNFFYIRTLLCRTFWRRPVSPWCFVLQYSMLMLYVVPIGIETTFEAEVSETRDGTLVSGGHYFEDRWHILLFKTFP